MWLHHITDGRRLILLATSLLLAVLLSGIVESRASTGSTPLTLACPSEQPTWLRGQAPPGSALIARFGAAAVGGGSAGPDGSWAIPLTVQERPGIYPLVVEDRQDGHTVAAFTCYVDVPIGAAPTGTPTARPAGSPSAGSPSSSSPAPAAETTPTPATITPTEQKAPRTATSTPSSSGGSPAHEVDVAPSESATPVPVESATPAPTGTTSRSPDAQAAIAILAAQPHDPAAPELFEYVLLENLLPVSQDLTGWSLTHGATGERYTLPELLVPAGGLVAIWSGGGVDDPETGTLYWPATQGRWSEGHVAELRTPDGRLASALTVSPEPDRTSEGAGS